MQKIDALSRKLMAESLRHYAKENLPFDTLRQYDGENYFPPQKVKEIYKDLGINLLLIPQEYGGLASSTSDIYRVCQELGRIDLGIATAIFATFLGSDPINVGGTEEQKKYWFTKMARENLLVAYGATEADAGSDLVALKTRAEQIIKDGKITHYKINGSKMWISNGEIADLYTILALTPGGPSWFLVPKDTPGFTQLKHEDKHGIRLANTAGLCFENVIVPAENLIGLKEGQGFLQAQAVFGYTRLMVGALALGAGQEAIENAIVYANNRVQAASPLSHKQGYMHKLIVPHYIKFEAARAFIDKTAKILDINNHGQATEGAIAKYYASRAANSAADDAIEAFGGFGYTKDFPVEKIKRDVKITCIYEGTSEIMEMTIYRGRWQEHLKTRGNFYLDMAREMENIKETDLGAKALALGLKALSEVLEECRLNRLTRHQYITFELGRLIANAEVAFALVKQAKSGQVVEGCPFNINIIKTMARVNAKNVSLDIALAGAKLVNSALEIPSEKDFYITEITKESVGLVKDMDALSIVLRDMFRN
ncbi:MAG: acyl-CoA dehydrogenase family protein [Elusimicrobiaceae bacterium]|nr:acyl-CoA dehydrogenase family protein [Elusimicrobiaceae bacterium]